MAGVLKMISQEAPTIKYDVVISVAEPHHFDAAPAFAPGRSKSAGSHYNRMRLRLEATRFLVAPAPQDRVYTKQVNTLIYISYLVTPCLCPAGPKFSSWILSRIECLRERFYFPT
jgi:hypothetical protein